MVVPLAAGALRSLHRRPRRLVRAGWGAVRGRQGLAEVRSGCVHVCLVAAGFLAESEVGGRGWVTRGGVWFHFEWGGSDI